MATEPKEEAKEVIRGLRERQAEAHSRGETPEEHLWCLALAVGPDSGGAPEWEAAGGTPVDVARHLTELARAVAGLRRERDEAVELYEGAVVELLGRAEQAESALNEERASSAALRERLAAWGLDGDPAPNRFECLDCGTGVRADAEMCCMTCGADVFYAEDGRPLPHTAHYDPLDLFVSGVLTYWAKAGPEAERQLEGVFATCKVGVRDGDPCLVGTGIRIETLAESGDIEETATDLGVDVENARLAVQAWKRIGSDLDAAETRAEQAEREVADLRDQLVGTNDTCEDEAAAHAETLGMLAVARERLAAAVQRAEAAEAEARQLKAHPVMLAGDEYDRLLVAEAERDALAAGGDDPTEDMRKSLEFRLHAARELVVGLRARLAAVEQRAEQAERERDDLGVELFDEKGHAAELVEKLADAKDEAARLERERDEAVESYEGAVVELLARAEQAERERDALERTLTKIWPVCETARKAVHDTNGGVGSMFAIANRLEKEGHRQAQRAKRAAADVHKGTEHLTALVFEVRKRVRQLGLAVGHRIMGDEPARGDGGGTDSPERVAEFDRAMESADARLDAMTDAELAAEYPGAVEEFNEVCGRADAERGTPESAPPGECVGGYEVPPQPTPLECAQEDAHENFVRAQKFEFALASVLAELRRDPTTNVGALETIAEAEPRMLCSECGGAGGDGDNGDYGETVGWVCPKCGGDCLGAERYDDDRLDTDLDEPERSAPPSDEGSETDG